MHKREVIEPRHVSNPLGRRCCNCGSQYFGWRSFFVSHLRRGGVEEPGMQGENWQSTREVLVFRHGAYVCGKG
jgi:hypothetical protein